MIGLLLYFRKTGQKPVVFATWLAGAFGGLALTTAQFVKLLCYSPGNPGLPTTRQSFRPGSTGVAPIGTA